MKKRSIAGAASLVFVITSSASAQDAGKAAFQACSGCHSIGTEGDKIEGPNLKGIIGRRIAAQSGFKYSEAIKKFASEHPVWTEDMIDQYVKNPDELVPGTAMNNAPSVRSANTRKAIIEYIKAQK